MSAMHQGGEGGGVTEREIIIIRSVNQFFSLLYIMIRYLIVHTCHLFYEQVDAALLEFAEPLLLIIKNSVVGHLTCS